MRMNQISARPPSTPTTRPTIICSANAPATSASAPAPSHARRDEAQHQRDADGVVRTGLPFEDGAAAAGDLAPAQHREDHRRVVGATAVATSAAAYQSRPKAAWTSSAHPPAVEESVPSHAHHGDRHGRLAEPSPADAHAAVEQDQHERDADHLLDRPRRWRSAGRHDLDREWRPPRAAPRPRGCAVVRQPVGEDRDDDHEAGDQHHQRRRTGVSCMSGVLPVASQFACRPDFPAHQSCRAHATGPTVLSRRRPCRP